MKKLFSLITLVGVFAACQPETIETTFDPDPAQVTIKAVATEILTGDDVTSKATFTADKGTFSGNVLTLVGNPSITATTINVSATYNGETYGPVSVSIRTIAAGGRADYAVNVIVGKVAPTPGGIEIVKSTSKKDSVVFTLKNASHDGSFSHDGHSTSGTGHSITHNGAVVDTWMLNNTEMVLNLYTTYTKTTGKRANIDVEGNLSEAEWDYLILFKDSIEKPEIEVTSEKYEFQVSAWAYYNVMQTRYETTTIYTINRVYSDDSRVAIGSIDLHDFSSDIVAYEFASNTHYIAGHGHGHSHSDEHGSENAGGGIAYAD